MTDCEGPSSRAKENVLKPSQAPEDFPLIGLFFLHTPKGWTRMYNPVGVLRHIRRDQPHRMELWKKGGPLTTPFTLTHLSSSIKFQREELIYSCSDNAREKGKEGEKTDPKVL